MTLRRGLLPVMLALMLVAPMTRPQAWPGAVLTASTDYNPPAARPVDSAVHVLAESGAGVTIEVRPDVAALRLDGQTLNDERYVRVGLQDWPVLSDAGSPALPYVTAAIGAPFESGVRVEVTAGPVRVVKLPAPVLPAPGQIAEWHAPGQSGKDMLPMPVVTTVRSPGVYENNTVFPKERAAIVSDGTLRQQRVLGVAVYPIQFDPATNTLNVYEWLRVTVTFDAQQPSTRLAPTVEAAAYEALLAETLLNYETARSWRAAAASPMEVAAGDLSWAPPTPGWRIKVRDQGVYRVTYAELAAAGVPVGSLNPRTLRLLNRGAEIALRVEGESDGAFDASDYIEFYGQSVSSKYTADNVYWLTFGGPSGRRMATRDATPGGAAEAAAFQAVLNMERNNYYLTTMPGNDDLERWLWDYIYPPSRPTFTYEFTLAMPAVANARLTVAMLGFLQNAVTPDHHARITLNGVVLSDEWWDGRTWRIAELTVPAGVLVSGNNRLQITGPNDTGVGSDVYYVDWAKLEYSSGFVAGVDALNFTYGTAGTWKFAVGGLASDAVAVYDVTDPVAAAQLTGVSVVAAGTTYAARFQDNLGGATSYLVMPVTAYRHVRSIEQDAASTLHASNNGADHIVITHRDFMAQATALRDYRATQMRAVVVDVQDVYDEFSYGLASAAAIRDFLAYAYQHWQAPAPSYAVLVGDGNNDPKNYKGNSRTSYMPAFLVAADPWLTETAADNRYVMLAGNDSLPDMMLGRLSVDSPAEANAFVSKIVAYEQTSPSASWAKQVLMVADNSDGGGDFVAFSDGLVSCCLPSGYATTKVYHAITHPTTGASRAAIQAGINAGKLLVNYVGHGWHAGWADESLLKASDVPALTNGTMQPVVLAMTCWEGYFAFPDPVASGFEALGETITRAEGRGAVASWSPTGLGVASGHDYLNRGFYDAIFSQGVGTVGAGTLAGKLRLWLTGSNLDLMDTYLLFGDPATRMPVTVSATATPTRTSTPTKTPIGMPTATPTATLTPGGPPTGVVTKTATPGGGPTWTETPTVTHTPGGPPTAVLTKTWTRTSTPSPTPTVTATPTATPVARLFLPVQIVSH